MTINDYIEHFDAVWGTKISETIKDKKFPLLEYAYTELAEQIYALNNNTRQVCRKKNNVYDKLEKSFSDEQRDLVDRYFELESEYWEATEMQIFTFGYLLCYQELKDMGALKD